jgi:hypothetical protein
MMTCERNAPHQVEGRRLRQLAKQFDAEVAAIAAREDKAAKLEYAALGICSGKTIKGGQCTLVHMLDESHILP